MELARGPFERVVTEHGARVWRVCRGMLPPHDADDAWAETFLSAMQAWPRLPLDADVSAWLVVIAHRKAIDVLRRSARTAVVAEVPDGASPLGRPDGRDLDLWAALATLPDKQRSAVVQHHLGGLPFAEVAELTGTTPAAARKAASDGVHRLRTLLGKDHR